MILWFQKRNQRIKFAECQNLFWILRQNCKCMYDMYLVSCTSLLYFLVSLLLPFGNNWLWLFMLTRGQGWLHLWFYFFIPGISCTQSSLSLRGRVRWGSENVILFLVSLLKHFKNHFYNFILKCNRSNIYCFCWSRFKFLVILLIFKLSIISSHVNHQSTSSIYNVIVLYFNVF